MILPDGEVAIQKIPALAPGKLATTRPGRGYLPDRLSWELTGLIAIFTLRSRVDIDGMNECAQKVAQLRNIRDFRIVGIEELE